MRTTTVCFLILLACVTAWAYQTHPKAFKDFIASFLSNPDNSEVPPPVEKPVAPVTPRQVEIITPETTKYLPKEMQPNTQPSAPALTPSSSSPSASGKVFVPPAELPKQDNWTWVTTDGKTYKNVVITKVEADCVTIMHEDGGGLVNIATLPADIQKQLAYDPDMAQSAAEARIKAEVDRQTAIQAEAKRKHDQMQVEAPPPQTPQKPSTKAPSKTPEEIAAIQQQIDSLNSDIAFMKQEEAKLYNGNHLRVDGGAVSRGAYSDKIAEEETEVRDLRNQLAQ